MTYKCPWWWKGGGGVTIRKKMGRILVKDGLHISKKTHYSRQVTSSKLSISDSVCDGAGYFGDPVGVRL
jgi:hypothetical protein